MSNNTRVKIDSVVMEETAKILEGKIRTLESLYTAIENDAKRLKASEAWEGVSADAYSDVMRRLCSLGLFTGNLSSGRNIRALRRHKRNLDKMVEMMRRTVIEFEIKLVGLNIRINYFEN